MMYRGCETQPGIEQDQIAAIQRRPGGWRCNRGFLLGAVLLVAGIAGCGSEQSDLVNPNSSAVSLNITMPDKVVAVSDPLNRLWAAIQRWVFPTNAWAATRADLRLLRITVSAPELSSPLLTDVPITNTDGEEPIEIVLNVPVGDRRVFSVFGLDTNNATIFRGESAPVTIVPGQVETINITLVNITAPIANAGPDQQGLPGALITLDGSASSDPNGDQLNFSWSFTRPSGSQAVLLNPTSVSPTFIVDRDGDYVIQLIVNDGSVSSSPDTVIVTSNNLPPVANAGSDRTEEIPFEEPDFTVTLNGSASSDPNGDPLASFRWAFISRPPGSETVLENATTVAPTFRPDRLGVYVIQLIVNDGTVDSDTPDSVTITVVDQPILG